MFPKPLAAKAVKLLARCRKRGVKLTAAESCTGGLLAALITDIPGASDVFDRGFVTYADAAKTAMLGVPAAMIKKHGAVSAEVAGAMAEGAVKRGNADIAAAITGIAGPSGGTKEKPVGLVYIAAATPEKTTVKSFRFKGNRGKVRLQAVGKALDMLNASLRT